MQALLLRFVRDESGQGLLAQIVLMSGLSLVIIPSVQDFGAQLAEAFNKIARALH